MQRLKLEYSDLGVTRFDACRNPHGVTSAILYEAVLLRQWQQKSEKMKVNSVGGVQTTEDAGGVAVEKS